MKYLIDECLSPELAKMAIEKEPCRLDEIGRPEGLGA